jgi:hypothetical protein
MPSLPLARDAELLYARPIANARRNHRAVVKGRQPKMLCRLNLQAFHPLKVLPVVRKDRQPVVQAGRGD